jgi:hypothetical protein
MFHVMFRWCGYTCGCAAAALALTAALAAPATNARADHSGGCTTTECWDCVHACLADGGEEACEQCMFNPLYCGFTSPPTCPGWCPPFITCTYVVEGGVGKCQCRF